MRKSKLPFESVVLCLGFAATGVGLALPGILLPALMQAWKLQDSRAGLLFLRAWCGTSVGALMVRGKLKPALASGGILTAIGAVGLAELPGWNFPWLMASYGLGLGLTMTSISLLRQRKSSQRSESETEMVRLNLLWAVGACACPALAIRALQSGNIRPMLIGLGLVFAALAVWVLGFLHESARGTDDLEVEAKPRQGRTSLVSVPLSLLLMLFLVTGIEAAAGGWLTTFAQREHGELALTVAAPTCLWAGLLVSRAIWSLRILKFESGRIVQGSLLMLSASALLLVLGSSGWAIPLAAFGIGFSLGPVYPLLLARALAFHPTGALFFIAGLGSAALPWLTGVLSQMRSSLKDGLLVPMAAAFLMLALALVFPERKDGRARSRT